jgi:hypothetical protein
VPASIAATILNRPGKPAAELIRKVIMSGQRIRIRLKAFDHRIIDQSVADIVKW